MTLLTNSFFDRSPLKVAQDLLGKILVRKIDGQIISGRIVETESYLAFVDEAAHSFKGRTKSNGSVFKGPGTIYIHSMHMQNCIDIVTEKEGVPSGVLIRALEPLEGIELMKKFRQKENLKDLTSGPGKLCRALNITKEFDGGNISNEDSNILIYDDGFKVQSQTNAKRIGLSKAVDSEYRFYITGNQFVSNK